MIKQIKHRPNKKNNQPALKKQEEPLFISSNKQNQQSCQESNQIQTKHDFFNSKKRQSSNEEKILKKEFLRTIVSINGDYFRQKLKIRPNGKPNKLRLKIPMRNTRTTYREQYTKKQANTKSLKPEQDYSHNNLKNLWIQNGSAYMKDYKGIRNTEKPMKNRLNTSIDKEAPHFLDSQYGLTFLNWGGENNVTSLKPYYSPATTNIPFSSKTSYQNDFCENSLNRSTSAKIVPLKRQQSNFFKSTNKIQTSYLTTSRISYSSKCTKREQNCKPKIHILGVNPNKFHGKTEYQNEYLNRPIPCAQEFDQIPFEEIEKIIIDQ